MATLEEITQYLKSNPSADEAATYTTLTDFINDSHLAGIEVLKGLQPDQLSSFVSLVISRGVSRGIHNGNLSDLEVDFLLSRHFRDLMLDMITVTIGVAVFEELR